MFHFNFYHINTEQRKKNQCIFRNVKQWPEWVYILGIILIYYTDLNDEISVI
jgi:hypothetical protein